MALFGFDVNQGTVAKTRFDLKSMPYLLARG